MNWADANDEAGSVPEVETPVVAPPTTNGWAPMEMVAVPETPELSALTVQVPRLIPNLGDTLVFFLLLVPAFIGGYILTFVSLLAVLHPKNMQSLIGEMAGQFRYAITLQAVVYGVEWALAALVFWLWWGKSLARGIGWNSSAARRWALRLALLGILTGLVMTLVGNFVPMPKTPPILEDLTKSRLGAWLMMIFGITLAPLTEELAFRGFLLMSLVNFFRWLERRGAMGDGAVRRVGIPVSIAITSLAFAMVHAGQVSHSWGPLLLIGTVSVILCIVRLTTNSVATGVVVHAAYNFTLFAGLLVQTDGFRHLEKLNG